MTEIVMDEGVPHYFLYGETESQAELELIHIETIAERGSTHEWEIKPHRHDTLLQLFWIDRGSMTASIDAKVERCYGRSILLIPPSVVHGFQVTQATAGLVITIADALLQEVLSETGHGELARLVSSPRILPIDQQNRAGNSAIRLIRQLDEEYRWPRPARVSAISALCKLILVNLVRMMPTEAATDESHGEAARQFDRFRDLLEHHYREQWTIRQYAECLGVSEKRLTRFCRLASDLSPLQIVHNRQLTEAKRCLVYTEMSISEIAYELGFKDPAYFSRFFSKMTDHQASQFRRQYQSGRSAKN
jgi:AraC family transcriptional activator of pobA